MYFTSILSFIAYINVFNFILVAFIIEYGINKKIYKVIKFLSYKNSVSNLIIKTKVDTLHVI